MTDDWSRKEEAGEGPLMAATLPTWPLDVLQIMTAIPPSDMIFYVVNVVDDNTESSRRQEGNLMTHSAV